MSKWIQRDTDGISLLADVDTSTAVEGDTLVYEGGVWVPGDGSTGGGPATVRVASAAAAGLVAFDAGAIVDGVVLVEGDRILIKNQDAPVENGIYVVLAAGAPDRAADLDTGAAALLATVLVEEGDMQAGTEWICKAPVGADTVGTDALPWTRTSALVTSPSAGEWRAQTTAGTPGAGIVRFNTDTKSSIVTVDLAFTPTVGGGYGLDAAGMIGIGSVLRFQHVVDSEDSINLLVTDLSTSASGWSATVDVLGYSGSAAIVNTYHYSLVVVGGAKPSVILYESASIGATSGSGFISGFTARDVGWYRFVFECDVTAWGAAIVDPVLTLTLEQSVGTVRRTELVTELGRVRIAQVIEITAAGPCVIRHSVSATSGTLTATMEDIQMTLEPFGKIDW